MNKRFSKEFLFIIRNHVPIDLLISDSLKIPNKISEGFFRFLCPVCGEFRTATDPKNNLARCFLCERRFNTIDIVKECNQLDFVEAVLYIDDFRTNLSKDSHRVKLPAPQPAKSQDPVPIGSVLNKIMPDLERASSNCPTDGTRSNDDLEIENRIARIESQLHLLFDRIQILEEKIG